MEPRAGCWRIALVLAASAGVMGCDLITGTESQACPQSGEFGNYGCARLVAEVEGPPRPWPDSYRFAVRAVSPDGHISVHAADPGVGFVPMRVTLRLFPLDTASLWITAKLLEDPRPVVVGVPLPVFAADSVLHVARFARVGSVPVTDTVRLTLRRE